MRFSTTVVAAGLLCCAFSNAQISPDTAALFVNFSEAQPNLHVVQGAKTNAQGRLEFTTSLQYAELSFSNKLNGISAMTVGGWFFPRRSGEQWFFSRGIPEIAPLGERMFRPKDKWVNFLLGTDQHGFFLGTINGNGWMPFPLVTIDEVPFDAWNQLVVVKDATGHHKFYHNGTLVHADANAGTAEKNGPFRDIETGEPVRIAMPLGGLAGEAWIFARALSADEIRQDYLSKRDRYKPALPVTPVKLREMNLHPAASLWKEAPTRDGWAQQRERIREAALKILGPFPSEKVALDPKSISEDDGGSYVRRKISIQVQRGDHMPFYLLVPKKLSARRVPAVICMYGTTSGAGKETTVGLSDRTPGSPPQRNAAFAIDVVEAGFVALAADYLRDGERIKPGRRPYDTTDFYNEFPDWSAHGKDIWDNMRAIDYLQSLDFVDPEKIGITGHSYGGHSTIFTAAMEPRIKVAVANGPVSDFLHHGTHWGVPKGAGNSQSMPNLRPYVLDHTLPLPITFYEFTSLIAPRPLMVGQAIGERRPMEEENASAMKQVYDALGVPQRVRYHWYAGDHDYPPEARQAAMEWFKRWFGKD
jgi:dienelactone hydrolase